MNAPEAAVTDRTPLRRLAKPANVATAVCLASRARPYVTSQSIIADGRAMTASVI